MIPMFSIFSQASSPLRSLIVEIRPVVLRIAVQYCEDAVRPHPQSPGPTLFFGPVAPTLVGIPLAVGGYLFAVFKTIIISGPSSYSIYKPWE
jgi:hypothetical protein